ncbi:hypothetical protein Z043_119724, partial [Scleropages formosus]
MDIPTTQPSPVLMTHKRAFSDEASKVTTFLPWPRAIENLKAQSRALSRSSLCINGIHVYGGEPAVPRSVSVLQTRLGLLDKCSPLSRSLQNLTRRGEDHARAVGGGRRWSFDRSGKEEKAPLSPCPGRVEVSPEERPLVPPVAPAAKPEPADEVKKPRKNLFSQGRSESAGKGAGAARGQHGQGPACAEERHRGWFGAKDPQNKPSPASAPSVDAPGSPCHTNPFTPAAATPPMSPSNPFFTRLQCNPFFEELIADQTLKFAPCHSSSPPWHSIASPSCPSTASPFLKNTLKEGVVSNMERPVGIVRQNSLPEQLPMAPGSAMIRSSSILSTRSMSENYAEWDDSFEAFAASRLKLPKEPVSGQLSGVSSGNRTNATPQDRPTGQIVEETAVEVVQSGNAPPLPPRRPSRVPVKDLQQDSWLDWAQELAVKKEACLLSQTDAASLQHQREQDPKRTGTHLFQRSSSETEPISTRDGNSWGSGCSPSFPSLFQKQTTETPIAQCNCSPQPTGNEASSGDRSSSETRCYSAMSTSSEDATTISTANDNAVNELLPSRHQDKNFVPNTTDEHQLPLGKEGKEETDSWTKELGEALGEIHFQSQGLAEQQMEAKSPTQSICSNPLTVTADIKISLNSALLKYDQQECASLGPSLSESMKEISFKDIHVSLAPDCRSHRQTDQTSELHLSSRASSASSPAADTNSQSALSPSPNLPLLSVRPSAGTTQAAAPSSTVQPLIGATHMVLPEETQLASSFLSHHESSLIGEARGPDVRELQMSSPHPVKPLTTAAIQGEKKAEGRSVLASGLEKLKSTIHPGRTSVQSESEGSK